MKKTRNAKPIASKPLNISLFPLKSPKIFSFNHPWKATMNMMDNRMNKANPQNSTIPSMNDGKIRSAFFYFVFENNNKYLLLHFYNFQLKKWKVSQNENSEQIHVFLLHWYQLLYNKSTHRKNAIDQSSINQYENYYIKWN